MSALAFMAGLDTKPGRQARSKRPRTQNAGESGSEQLDQQIKQLGNQLPTVMKIVGQHGRERERERELESDRESRELEGCSCHTYLLSKNSRLAEDLLARRAGPHPQGPPRWTAAGTVADALVEDSAPQAQMGKFVAFHEGVSSLADMESSIQFAVAKEPGMEKFCASSVRKWCAKQNGMRRLQFSGRTSLRKAVSRNRMQILRLL